MSDASVLLLSVPWCAVKSSDGIGAPCKGCPTPEKCQIESMNLSGIKGADRILFGLDEEPTQPVEAPVKRHKWGKH